MQGYWKDPKSTAKALSAGYYRTGDQAYKDADGYYFIVGRKDDQLKVGGHRVNPHEIEDILMETGMLMEVAVLGISDDLLGQKLVACIVPKTNSCTEEQAMAFCAQRLPRFKVPSSILLVRSLPKSSSGKIDRTKCLEIFKTITV
jgi:acyl-CoA synthetase (AMP-forming)/AMP-acid ligase II